MQIVSSIAVAPAERYARIVDQALSSADRMVDRTDRIIEDAARGLGRLDPDRISGAVDQANDAITYLAAAERYRTRSALGEVPQDIVNFVLQAANDIEMGSRALRRVSALITDPDIDSDPRLHQGIIDSLSLAQSHFHMAQWELRNVGPLVPPVMSPDDREIPAVD